MDSLKYFNFKINSKANLYTENKTSNKPSSATKELQIIEKIVKNNIQKLDSDKPLSEDAEQLRTLLDNVHTIAEGFNTKATNKLVSISGRFFETLRRKIINRKNLAVQNQMRSIEILINEKLDQLNIQEVQKNNLSENDTINDDQKLELEENTDDESKLEENTSDLTEDNELELVENKYTEENEHQITDENKSDLIEDNGPKLEEDKSDLTEENEQELIIKENEKELVIEEKELIEDPKAVETKIIIEEETEDEIQLSNNRTMIEEINETPIKFINYLEGAIRSEINPSADPKKLNDLIEVLFQLFPGSAFEDFIQQLIPYVINQEGNTFQTLIDFCKELTPNSGILKYVNKANNIFTFKNDVIQFFEPNTKINFLKKGILKIALGSKVVDFVLENKDHFKTELYDHVKEESNLKRAMDNFSLMINILKTQTSKKDAVPAIKNAILNIVIFILEAIKENNGKK